MAFLDKSLGDYILDQILKRERDLKRRIANKLIEQQNDYYRDVERRSKEAEERRRFERRLREIESDPRRIDLRVAPHNPSVTLPKRRYAVPLYRATFRFKSQDYGWSENYYLNQPSSTFAITAASFYHTPRIACLLNTARMQGFSVRQMEAPFASRSVSLTPPAGTGLVAPLAGAGGEPPYSALYLLARSTSDRPRQIHLRGVPTEIIDSEGDYVPDPAFTVALNALIGAIITSFQLGFQQFSQDRGLTSAVVAGGTSQQLTVGYDGAAINLMLGDLVQLTGISSPRGVAKIMRVAVASAASPVTLGPYPYPLAGTWSGAGRMKVLSLFSGEAFSTIVPLKGVKRATGRPFDLPRGRRRAR